MEKEGGNNRYITYYSKISTILLRVVFFNVLILIALSSFAKITFALNYTSDEIMTSEKLMADVALSSVVTISPLNNEGRINKLTVDLGLFPRESAMQKVISIRTGPKATVNLTVANFVWEQPKDREVPFMLSSKVEVKEGYVPIAKKVDFPVLNIEPELRKYTLPQDNIDSANKDIIEKASEIAAGEDDMYVVVFNIADWVEGNIKYSLDSLTSDSSQKASWVLKNKEGVCDELSSLFIAMVRSVGIPARYVSGVAYTNWNDLNDFGPHAWAEVYFPGYGWIPFDVTYGEFGYVDSSHIKLKDSLDSNEASVSYRWEGWMVDTKAQRLDINTEITSLEGKISPVLLTNIEVLKNSIGFGSYNIVEVDVKNPTIYYVPSEISLSRSTNMELIGKQRRQILLMPNETKKLYWIIKVDSNLEKNYVYTFKLSADVSRGGRAQTTFTSSFRDENYDLDYVQSQLKLLEDEKQKIYSNNITLNCGTERKEYYTDEIIKMTCNLKNSGNTYLKDVKICYKNNCKYSSLPINGEGFVYYALNFSTAGAKSIDVIASGKDFSKTTNFMLTMLDKPELNISSISIPEKIEFGKSYSLDFTVKKESFSEPAFSVVILETPMGVKQWELANLEENRKFHISFDSSQLGGEESIIRIKLEYSDLRGQKYGKEQLVAIKIENLTWIQKIQLELNGLSNKVSWMDPGFLALILLGVIFVFGILIGIIFMHRRGVKEIKTEIEAEGVNKDQIIDEIEEEEEIEKTLDKKHSRKHTEKAGEEETEKEIDSLIEKEDKLENKKESKEKGIKETKKEDKK